MNIKEKMPKANILLAHLVLQTAHLKACEHFEGVFFSKGLEQLERTIY